MPIISPIGRRHWKTRLLVGLMYVLLLAGSVSMLYPFLLMLAGSSKSSVDAADQKIIPAFILSDTALYQKHVEGLFNESLNQMRWMYGSDVATFQQLVLLRTNATPALVAAWREFLLTEELPAFMYGIGYLSAPQSRGSIPSGLRAFKLQMEQEYGNDITRLNEAMGTTFSGWNAFFVLPKNGLERRVKTGNRPFDTVLAEFARHQPLENRIVFNVEGFYKAGYLKNQFSRDIAAYNRVHGTTYTSWDDIHLERRLPDPDRCSQLERDDWERFVRGVLSLDWIRADASAVSGYRDYLRAKYTDIAKFNHRSGSSFQGFEQVPFPNRAPEEGVACSDWESYLQGWRDPATDDLHMLPAEAISLDTVEFRFRDWLQKRGAKSDLGILPPQQDFQYLAFKANTTALRYEFLTRNFRTVTDYVVRHGRAVMNSIIYCGLSVLCALIFNPLAAYALSRYKPKSTYKILLFLMMTMAFPPMVTQIPVFLMLRQFHMLNTFAALVLPGLVNGYTIFLLKGFFDSLPRELYECAQLDGAGEFRLFWQITMWLSTPILAVTALGAFTAAYSNFMMALLLCQDERMWTIMPWLYQLQTTSGQGVVFASLIIASIPTMLVFIFCQKIILRGIVVPVEK